MGMDLVGNPAPEQPEQNPNPSEEIKVSEGNLLSFDFGSNLNANPALESNFFDMDGALPVVQEKVPDQSEETIESQPLIGGNEENRKSIEPAAPDVMPLGPFNDTGVEKSDT